MHAATGDQAKAGLRVARAARAPFRCRYPRKAKDAHALLLANEPVQAMGSLIYEQGRQDIQVHENSNTTGRSFCNTV